MTIFTVVALTGSKLLSGYFSMRVSGFARRASVAAGLMTVPQLSATLAAAAIGRELGILDSVFFNAIIVLSIAAGADAGALYPARLPLPQRKRL